MSLYGDLPPPSSAKDSLKDGVDSLGKNIVEGGTVSVPPSSVGKAPLSTKSSLSAPQFLPSTVLRKPNKAMGSKFTSFRKPPVFKPTINPESVVPTPTPITPIQQVTYQPPKLEQPKNMHKTGRYIQDEYDPAYPNDYAEMQRLRDEARQALSSRSYSCSRSPSPQSNNSCSGSPKSGSQSPAQAPLRQFSAVPPPASLAVNSLPPAQSGEEAYLRRLQLSHTTNNLQNLSSLNAFETSRVLMLMNMVGREEADDQLGEEVKKECIKYGQVLNCFVYVAPPDVPDQHSVRIFVEFTTNQSACIAKKALHNRLFGGRNIHAELFDPVRFRHFDFASRPEELARTF